MNIAQVKAYETVGNLLSQREHNNREIMRHCGDIKSLEEDNKHLKIAYDLAVAEYERLGENE